MMDLLPMPAKVAKFASDPMEVKGTSNPMGHARRGILVQSKDTYILALGSCFYLASILTSQSSVNVREPHFT